MFDDNNFVDRLLEKSDAVLIIQEATEKLKVEEQRRQEFYKLIGEDGKAEFVNGEIIFHSPVMKTHTDAAGMIYILMSTFVRKMELGWVGYEKAITRFTRNDYEPDVCFFGNEKAKDFQETQLLYPVPDFVAEVLSKSSQKNIDHDRVTKFNDYEKHGMSEYWIVDPHEQTVEQYVLKNKKYQLVLEAPDGIIRCQAVKGFNIPTAAIFDGKKADEAMELLLSGGLPK